MNPPSVLLDHSFLVAVGDIDDVNHDDAVTTYQSLIDDFVEQRCLIVARADHLAAVAEQLSSNDLFAAVDKLHVARQHRNAAAELTARRGIGIDQAITLVMVHRLRIRRVVTFDEELAGLGEDGTVSIPAGAADFGDVNPRLASETS
jgi:predicted nucleic acid-binding protein